MKKMPDSQEWTTVLVRLGTILAAGWLTVHSAEDKEVMAKANLSNTEQREATDNAYLSYGEYATDVQKKQAACDSALESFKRHQSDPADFDHMWKMCHSEE